MSAQSSALHLWNLQLRQRLQELLGSHRDGDQALDQVHDRVGVALLAQEIVRVVDDARRLVCLHVVAVDDPLERAAVRYRVLPS